MRISSCASAYLDPIVQGIKESACRYPAACLLMICACLLGLAEVRRWTLLKRSRPTKPQLLSHKFPTPRYACDSTASTSCATPSMHCVHTSFYEEGASAGTSRAVYYNSVLLTFVCQRHERSRQIPARYARVAPLKMFRYRREAFFMRYLW
jgi:hypothetical protein